MHNQLYWLGNEPVTFYARENADEIWVERPDGSLLLLYERGLATSPPRVSTLTQLRLASHPQLGSSRVDN